MCILNNDRKLKWDIKNYSKILLTQEKAKSREGRKWPIKIKLAKGRLQPTLSIIILKYRQTEYFN